MRIVTFYTAEGPKLGVKIANGILDVGAAAAVLNRTPPESADDLIAGGEEALQLLGQIVDAAAVRPEFLLEEERLTFAPVVQRPQKIICVGLNYERHASELGLPRPQTPVLFSKFNNALTGHGAVVELPAESQRVDYEAELAVVIGRRAKDVSVTDALTYAFGYCTANDISARDLQNRTSQWLLGKTCDGFCPLGPYLVTADEVPDPNNLAIRTWVNGELRQDSNTSDMIFGCAELISYISRHMTLEPGDVILTGTPQGVAAGYPSDVRDRYWLKDGDEVVVEVEGLGRLRNVMRVAR